MVSDRLDGRMVVGQQIEAAPDVAADQVDLAGDRARQRQRRTSQKGKQQQNEFFHASS